jgi:hypothetical protein
MKCDHANFDEYFGKCTDCEASRKQVIAEQFVAELQPVYTKMLESLGIETGDIEPMQAVALEEKELALAEVVASWLDNRYEGEE